MYWRSRNLSALYVWLFGPFTPVNSRVTRGDTVQQAIEKMQGQLDAAGVGLEDTVTEESSNAVKSSGIWTWVKELFTTHTSEANAHPATAVSVDTSGFVKNLATTDDTVQKIADKVDALTTGSNPFELIYTKPVGDINSIVLTHDKNGVAFNFVEGDTIMIDVSVQLLTASNQQYLYLNDIVSGFIFFTGNLNPREYIFGSVAGSNMNIFKTTWVITLLNNEISGYMFIQGTSPTNINSNILYAISSRGFNAATINKLTITKNTGFYDAGTKVLIKKL